MTRWQPSQGSKTHGILSSLPQVLGMRSQALSLRQILPLSGADTPGSHLRLRGVPPGPDTAPWRQVGASAAHANKPAARRADWLARIPAAFPGRGPRQSKGAPPAAAAPAPRSRPPSSPGTSGRVRATRAPSPGASPPVVRSVLLLNPSRVRDDDPTPRPTVQAEDGISAEGERGPVPWALGGARGPNSGKCPRRCWGGAGRVAGSGGHPSGLQ